MRCTSLPTVEFRLNFPRPAPQRSLSQDISQRAWCGAHCFSPLTSAIQVLFAEISPCNLFRVHGGRVDKELDPRARSPDRRLLRDFTPDAIETCTTHYHRPEGPSSGGSSRTFTVVEAHDCSGILAPSEPDRPCHAGKHGFQSAMSAFLRSETYKTASAGNTDSVPSQRVRAGAQNRSLPKPANREPVSRD